MWGQDKFGNFRQINGLQSIKPSPESNSIRFKLRFKGFLYGYVVGDFNNWQKHEDYRLNWKPDYNDGVLRMIKDVSFKEKLPSGRHEYTYILIDSEGNEVKLSLSDQSFEPFYFTWFAINYATEIKSSEDVVTVGFPLDLVAIQNSSHNRKEVVDVKWAVFPKTNDITIGENGQLLVLDNPDELEEIKIKCYDQHNNTVAERVFKVITQAREASRVHFIKMDNIYSGNNFCWDIWAFDNDKPSKVIDFAGHGDFGIVADCDMANIIVRKKVWGDGWCNEWSEQTPSFNLKKPSRNFYVIYGDDKIYTSLKDVVTYTNPKIEYAVMDDSDKITAYLSHEPLIGTQFELFIDGIRQDGVIAIIKYERKQVIFTNLPSSVNSQQLIEIRATNTFLPTRVILRDYLNRYYYSGNDMGVRFFSHNISFKLWAPTAIRVELLLYKNWDSANEEFSHKFNLEYDVRSGVHSTIIERKLEHFFYLYKLHFHEIDQNGKQCTKVTFAVDPYATAIGLNGNKGYLIDINARATMSSGWLSDCRPYLAQKEDSIIYELHIRDFTIMPESGVKEEYRGKFMGMSQSGTHLSSSSGNVATGVDSLVELGITHVHLLPFFDFATVDESRLTDPDNRNWGYDPKNFNAPDGSYSVDPYDPSLRIKEVRSMIHNLHQKGIRVIMDVVYNHMYDTRNMDNIVPGYYFRTDSLGKFTNGSGCGNELATERPMVSKFVVDSVLHWVKNYNIDGVRFDLMELIDFDTIQKIVKVLHDIDPTILVYGEPWKGGDSPLSNGTYRGRQRNRDFAIFNDIFRNAIRGSNDPGVGYVNGDPHSADKTWAVVEGLKGSIYSLTFKPSESINYVDAHDNYTLWDHIEKSQNHNLANGKYRLGLPQNVFESSLVRQNLLAMAIILTAQGIPFIHGGVEILRTKNGDHNSYQSGDIINAFYWQDKVRFKPVFDYIRGLIKLRKEHPAFRITDRRSIEDHVNVFIAKNDRSGVIVSHFKDHVNNDSWKDIVVIYNASAIDNYPVNDLLPPLGNHQLWHMVVNHEEAGITPIGSYLPAEVPLMKSYSIMVLHSYSRE